MKEYPWALNPVKLQRAISVLGNDKSEETLKAEYIKIGGLVDQYVEELEAKGIEIKETMEIPEEVISEAPVVEEVVTEEEVIETPVEEELSEEVTEEEVDSEEEAVTEESSEETVESEEELPVNEE